MTRAELEQVVAREFAARRGASLPTQEESDLARATLAALDAAGALTAEWRPIEAAPKWPGRLLAIMNGRHEIATWDKNLEAKRPRPFWNARNLMGTSWSRQHQPKWWQPLSAPPQEPHDG